MGSGQMETDMTENITFAQITYVGGKNNQQNRKCWRTGAEVSISGAPFWI